MGPTALDDGREWMPTVRTADAGLCDTRRLCLKFRVPSQEDSDLSFKAIRQDAELCGFVRCWVSML